MLTGSKTERLMAIMTAGAGIALLAFVALTAATPLSPEPVSTVVRGQMSDLPKPQYTAEGRMLRPTPSYRQWTFVGTPLTPNELNLPAAPFPEFHNVYVHPDDFRHYSETGEWPNGTYFVKELVSIGAKRASSGNGYFQGEFIGLEVSVKDADRFPDVPGNWAYFSFGHEYPLADSAGPQRVSDCNVCHAANADDDWVFTQFYPVLRAAIAPAGQ